MTGPLIASLPFIDGETLSGYVSRSAKLFQTTPRDLCSDLGMNWPSLCSGRTDQIERLAWLIGADQRSLKIWNTYEIDAGLYRIGRTVAKKGVLRRTAVRLCPQCVISTQTLSGPMGVYQMLEWSVACIYSCPRHHCPLITLPSVAHTHSNYDFASRVIDRIDVVRRAADASIRLTPTSFEGYVRERIRHGPQADWLRGFDLMHLYRACSTLGAVISDQKEMALERLPSAKLQRLCQVGFENMKSGPQSYLGTLEGLFLKKSKDRPSFSVDMGQLYKWLRGAHSDPALVELLEITRRHIFKHYPIPINKQVFGVRPESQSCLTTSEARKRSHFGTVFLKKLVGYMNNEPETKAINRKVLHVDEIERAQEFWETLFNLSHAAKLLGTYPNQVRRLQDRGVFSVIRVTSSLRYVPKNEVSALLGEIRDLSTAPLAKSVVPMAEYCRSKGVPLARLVELWRLGKLNGQVFRGDGVGLHALEVDWNLECGTCDPTLDDNLHLTETARYLKIGINSVRKLRDSGMIEEVQHRNPDTNRLKSYISQASIKKFEQKYITLGQLAAQRKVEAMHLAQELDRADIRPISNGSGPLRVYDRLMI